MLMKFLQVSTEDKGLVQDSPIKYLMLQVFSKI